MKKITKALAAVLSLIVILSVVPVAPAFAEEVTTEYIPDSPFDVKPADKLNIPVNNKSGGNIPASFDVRDTIDIPAIRNQNPYGDCWAHASTAAIEVSLIKQGLATTDIDLSELNLVHTVYSETKDKMGLLGADKNEPVGSTALNLGGNNTEVAFSLARWSGICSEDAMNHSADTDYENAGGYYSEDYYYALNEAQLVKYIQVSTSESTDTLKQLIMDYGIAVTAYYDDSAYRNNTTGAIYSTVHTNSTNHEIAIIGWDDNYAVTNFNTAAQPSQPGAWLVRNSWGTYTGDDGYCWLSYEDTSLDKTMAFYTVCSSDTYDNNYQYDGTYSSSSSQAWHGAANIYTSQQNEYIKAVNLSLMECTDSDVTVRIYVNPSQNFLLDDTPEVSQTFHYDYEGIYTFTLDNPVYVTKGTDFAVYYTFSSDPTGEPDSHFYAYSKTTSWSWLNMKEDAANARCVCFNYSSCKTQNFTNGVWRIKAYTVNADLAVPDKLKVSLNGSNAVLSWDAVSGADAYEIYTGTDIGNYTLAAALTTNSATLPVTDANGIVVKYKVRAKNNNISGDFCNARVIRFASDTAISSLTLPDMTISLKETTQITPVFTPQTSGATVNDIMVYYTVADSGIATVTPTGEITGIKEGTTTVTALARNSAKTAAATVTVKHACVAGVPVIENQAEATCQQKGSYDSVVYCTVCGTELSRTAITTDFAHIKGEAKAENIIAAGCTTDGSYDSVIRCTKCDAVLSTEHKTVKSTGHTPGEAVYENTVASTCHTNGSAQKVIYCTTCTEEISRESVTLSLDSGKHTALVKHEGNAPSCTRDGWEAYETCADCGYDSYKAISATGHKDTDSDGYCNTCGEPITVNCSHMCHQSGFKGFIWKLVNFFNKLFKNSQYCSCGARHW